jgi:segregation and condensation protein B
MTDSQEHVAPSLDQLSQAFAEAMGRNKSVGESSGDKVSSPGNTNLSGERSDVEPVEVPDADAACPISPETILEAILFVGHPENNPITATSVARLLHGVDEAEVEELVDALNENYASAELPFRIANVGDGYRMELRDEFDHVRQRFYGRIKQARLSQVAVDVLAVVAYNQPITREAVDELLNTGKNSSRVLNQLVRRELLARTVTDDKPPRKEFITTDRFLALFNLRELGDLPRSEDPE